MSALPEKARRDLGKILGLLESEHAGERDAAIAAANRLLSRHGLRWCEVLLDAPVIKQQAEPRPEPPRPEPPHEPLNWRYLARRCAEFSEYLNEWENDFIDSLPGFPWLSLKQKAKLNTIVARLRAMGCRI